MLRALARNRAKVRMRKLGMRRFCKNGHFAGQWRKFGGYGKEKEDE